MNLNSSKIDCMKSGLVFHNRNNNYALQNRLRPIHTQRYMKIIHNAIYLKKKRRTFTSQKPWIQILACSCARCVTFYKTTHCGLLFIRSGVWDTNLNGCANNDDVEIGHLECCTIGWCCYSPKMVLTTTHISISWRNQLWIHRFWQHVREQHVCVCVTTQRIEFYSRA